MKNIKLYENFVAESKGIHPAIYSHLERFFKKNGGKGSFQEAKEYISSKMKNWDLSKDDYNEAKKRFV
jgi:hypothetical protein